MASNNKNLDPSSLDHNNIAIKYAGKGPLGKIPLPAKIVMREQPMRPFPGQIREVKHGVTGAVYAEDLDREEALMKASLDMKDEISKEDLMHEADFLKIDQSKLPLEIFDNLEYEALDKSPDQWLALSKRGYTPFYEMGEWSWKAVLILGYDEKQSEYQIQFYPDGKKKNVNRLNLRFEEEDEENFHARRNFATTAREYAKKVLQLVNHYRFD